MCLRPLKGQTYEATVASEVPDNLEAKLRIANVLEDMGRKAEALDIVTEGTSSSKRYPYLSDKLQSSVLVVNVAHSLPPFKCNQA